MQTVKISDKRVIVVVGHYGSGKTEFSVSLAYHMAQQGCPPALIDLDIANPYFRSREQKEPLATVGVRVYGNHYGREITAELPALSAGIRAPLEDVKQRVIVDVGGDNAGARVLNQFIKYFRPGEHELLCVVNCNRPETSTQAGALAHLQAIEAETDLKVTGLISNAHFTTFTQPADILEGWHFTKSLGQEIGLPVKAACAPHRLLEQTARLAGQQGIEIPLFPVGLYMRESWQDREI